MRSPRLALVGTVAFALLVAPVGAALAEDGSLEPEMQTGIIYGQEDPAKQKLIVLTHVPREEPRPAVVFFHGGGMVMGTPYADIAWAQTLAREGYVTVMADYRLFNRDAGTNPWPTQLEDAQRAVKWLRAHADEFNVDPERICAMGQSSGAHLAGLVGMTESDADFGPDLEGVSSRVDCVVAVSGPGDLAEGPRQSVWWTVDLPALLGGTVEEAPEAWEAASPVHNVDTQTPPFLVIHGTKDEEMPVRMSRGLVEALDDAGVEHVYEETNDDHFDVYAVEDKLPLVRSFLADRLLTAE